MFGVLSFAAVALVAASSASAAAIPHYTTPSTYDSKYLEPYDNYHFRYLTLDCAAKHNTAFFDACCHPLLKNQSLSSRPKECTPATPTTSTSAASATGGGDDEDCDGEDDGSDDEDCDDGENTTATATPTKASSSTMKPTTTPKVASAISKPTSTKKTTTSTPITKATPTPPSSSSQNSGGFATYFYQNGVAGACGTVHKDTDFIAAIDERRYGNSGAKSALCGKQVQLTNTKNGKSVTVTIADDCPTCTNSNSIDLSESAFKAIAPLSDGMVPIVWHFL